MKKKLWLLTILLTASVGSLLYIQTDERAVASDEAVLTVSTVYEETRGSLMNVNIEISGLDVEVAAGQLDLQFDEEAIQFRDRDTEMNSKLELGYFMDSTEDIQIGRDGAYKAAWAAAQPVHLNNETLIELTFRMSVSDGRSPLHLHDAALFDGDGYEIPVKVVHGKVEPFSGADLSGDSRERYPQDKVWNIELNAPVQRSSVNPNSVYVLDSQGDRVSTRIHVEDNGTVITVSPEEQYTRGGYVLYVTDTVKSLRGSRIQEPVKKEFRIE